MNLSDWINWAHQNAPKWMPTQLGRAAVGMLPQTGSAASQPSINAFNPPGAPSGSMAFSGPPATPAYMPGQAPPAPVPVPVAPPAPAPSAAPAAPGAPMSLAPPSPGPMTAPPSPGPQSTAWPANAGQGQPDTGLISRFVNSLRNASVQPQQQQQQPQGMLPKLVNDIGSIKSLFGGGTIGDQTSNPTILGSLF